MRGLTHLFSLFASLLSLGCLASATSLESLPLPADYLRFLQSHERAEGWLNDDYFILWRADELLALNRDYEAEHFAPGIFLFGSAGDGEAWGFDLRAEPPTVVRVPFVGLATDRAEKVADSFSELLHLSAAHPKPALTAPNNHAGMELFEIKPILFGGSPDDLANKEWVARNVHIQLVRFWNHKLETIMHGQRG